MSWSVLGLLISSSDFQTLRDLFVGFLYGSRGRSQSAPIRIHPDKAFVSS